MKLKNNYDPRIEAEQIRHIFGQTKIFVPLVMLSSLMTMLMLWSTTQPVIAISWCASVWLFYIAFWILIKRWDKAQPDNTQMKKWAKPYIILSWLAVASWSVIGFIFYKEDSMAFQSLLIVVLVAGAAAITATSTAYSPTFFPVLIILLPLDIRLFLEDKIIYQLMAFSIIVFVLMLYFLHKKSHAFYANALALRFKNEDLAQQLSIQKNIAEQANIDKSKFLAAVSHDLRQPLHAMSLFHGELALQSSDVIKNKMLINNMGLSIDSMRQLFDGLLDVSRFEVGVIQPDIKVFCVNELFDSLVPEYAALADKKGIRLRCVPSRVFVKSDPVLLRRILSNLLDNAVRYTSEGSILIGCRRLVSSVHIQVLDTGLGISDENKKNIFNEFQQINNPNKEQAKGVGLGLSVVKQLSSLLKHKLVLDSLEQKGSVFTLRVVKA